MSKIILQELTPKQEQLMHEVRQEWLDRFFMHRTFDEAEVKKGVKWLYEFSGLKQPNILIVDSPLAGQIAANVLNRQVWSQVESQVGSQVRSQVGSQVESQVESQVGSQVRSQVWSQVRSQVESQVESQVGSQVESQVESQVWSQVGGQVGSQVGGQVESQVWSQVGGQVESQVGGQVGGQVESQVWNQKKKFFVFSYYGNVSDYGWIAYIDFFERLGIVKDKSFSAFKKLIQSGVYDMIQLKELCIIIKPPIAISRLDGRLHSSTGASVKWADGYENYFLHGVGFEKEIYFKVMNGMDAKEIVSLRNAEQKQAIFKEFGYDKILSELDAKQVSNDAFGELIEIELGDDSKSARFVKVKCPSTDRTYILRVNPDCKTCKEGLAWMAYEKEEDYIMEIET